MFQQRSRRETARSKQYDWRWAKSCWLRVLWCCCWRPTSTSFTPCYMSTHKATGTRRNQNRQLRLDILKAINTFPAGSAGGLDGIITPTVLEGHDITIHRRGWCWWTIRINPLRLCQPVVSGHVPSSVRLVFYGAAWCALAKKGGGVWKKQTKKLTPIIYHNGWEEPCMDYSNQIQSVQCSEWRYSQRSAYSVNEL